jgi:2-polyprenyl-6-methoxyphenol hydroxylase-like FAD-dependent oxidoreductase
VIARDLLAACLANHVKTQHSDAITVHYNMACTEVKLGQTLEDENVLSMRATACSNPTVPCQIEDGGNAKATDSRPRATVTLEGPVVTVESDFVLGADGFRSGISCAIVRKP